MLDAFRLVMMGMSDTSD